MTHSTSTTRTEIQAILRVLRGEDWNWLEKFLRSPYHNSDERVLALFLCLKEARSNDFHFPDEALWLRLFPERPFARRPLRDLYRALWRLLGQFLREQSLRQRPLLGAYAQVRGLADRGLHLMAEQAAADHLAAPVADLPPWEAAVEYRRLQQERYESPAVEGTAGQVKALVRELDVHYFLLRLRYGIDLLSRSLTYAEDHDPAMAALSPLAERYRSASPLLDFYLDLYREYRDRTLSAEQLPRLEQRYYALFPNLPIPDRPFLLTKLLNLFNAAAQAGREGFREGMFRLHRFGLEREVQLVDGRLSEITFLNICQLGAALGEIAWTRHFRERYLGRLATDKPHNARHLSAGFLAFHQGAYEAVPRHLGQLRRPHLYQKLWAQMLSAQALLELYLTDEGYGPTLRARLNAFYRFIHRDKRIAGDRKRDLTAFVRILRTLVHVRERRLPSREARAAMQKALDNTEGTIALAWLKRKIEEW